MEETIFFAEQLCKRPLKQEEAEKIKKLLESYSEEQVEEAIEATYYNTGKLNIRYTETVLEAWEKESRAKDRQKISFADMPDKELYEHYLTIKVALGEHGHTENLINAYVSCTTEIACRYFDEKGLFDRKAREELLSRILKER